MKRTKYLTGALLFLIAFALIGELSVWRLSSFYTSFPSTTLYLQEGQNRSELIHDVKTAAKENGIEAFAVSVNMHSSFSVSLDIYGTSGVENYLKEHSKVSDGTFRSLFLGEVMISVQDLDELPEDFVPDRFLLTGDHDSNVLFKKALINNYAGNFPRQINASDENVLLIIGIWAIVFMLLLLLSNYEIALAKREVIVRMVSGEPLTAFVGTNILKDTLILSVAFGTAFLLLPLAKEHLLKGDISVNAITGSTGAGVKPSSTTHYSWRDNNISIYKPFEHQHVPEIMQSIKQLQPDFASSIDFIPYRGCFPRGIFATLVVKCDLDIETLYKLYTSYYERDSFTHVVKRPLDLKQVVNTNKCLIHLEKHGDKLLITSIIDNLLKGASGTAVHNMNLLFGLAETVGLQLKPSAF